jgi:hypothetical protein
MIVAAVPWGLNSREFIITLLGLTGITAGALVIILCTAFNAWRDVSVTKHNARKAEHDTPRSLSREAKRAADKVLRGPGIPGPLRRPATPTGFPEYDYRRMKPQPADRGRKSGELPIPPKGGGGVTPPKKPAERISAAADKDADRTRLDTSPLTPTEET